jgi:hypothetical protein
MSIVQEGGEHALKTFNIYIYIYIYIHQIVSTKTKSSVRFDQFLGLHQTKPDEYVQLNDRS